MITGIPLLWSVLCQIVIYALSFFCGRDMTFCGWLFVTIYGQEISGVCHNLCLALYNLCGWGYTVLWFRSIIIYAQFYTILWFKLIKLDGQEKISILANLTLGHFCFWKLKVSFGFRQKRILLRVLLKFLKPLALYINLAISLFLDSI